MRLEILLPHRVFADKTGVTRVIAETSAGSYGLLRHRLDCVAALVPGVLSYATETEGEIYVAIDAGVLVKSGDDIIVSVRNAIGGADLGELRSSVEQNFVELSERDKSVRLVSARLESTFVRRVTRLRHE